MTAVRPFRVRAVLLMCTLASGCTVMDGYHLPLDGGSGAASDPYATAVLASQPVAFYRLDDTAGTVAHDSSGNGNDCTYEGSVVLGVTGDSPGRKAVRLTAQANSSGTFPSVLCAGNVSTNLTAFTGTGPFAVEGWFALDECPGNGDYWSTFSRISVSGSNMTRNGYSAFVHSGGAGLDADSSGTVTCYVGDAPISCGQGQFVYLAYTYDGSTLSLYVDGQLGTMNASFACSGFPSAPGAEFIIGNFATVTCPSCAFAGAVEDVAVYDRVLPASEVQGHYRAAVAQ